MPWTLTTPVDTGDLDDVDYAELQIVRMILLNTTEVETIQVDWEYGNMVGGVWVKGKAPPYGMVTSVVIAGADYTDIVTNSVPDVQPSDPSNPLYVEEVLGAPISASVWVERTYVATKRGLYEWLNTNGYIGAGTVT